MTKMEAVKILNDHNQWRRGKTQEPTNPIQLGKAIDYVVKKLMKEIGHDAKCGKITYK